MRKYCLASLRVELNERQWEERLLKIVAELVPKFAAATFLGLEPTTLIFHRAAVRARCRRFNGLA
jgi:hypothetical protein